MDIPERIARMEPWARRALIAFAAVDGCTIEEVVAREIDLFGLPAEEVFTQATTLGLAVLCRFRLIGRRGNRHKA